MAANPLANTFISDFTAKGPEPGDILISMPELPRESLLHLLKDDIDAMGKVVGWALDRSGREDIPADRDDVQLMRFLHQRAYFYLETLESRLETDEDQ